MYIHPQDKTRVNIFTSTIQFIPDGYNDHDDDDDDMVFPCEHV